MTASGRYASSDPSFGRSTGNAAARGGALIAVAVVIGFLLLWKGGVGGSGSGPEVAAADSDDASQEQDDSSNDDTTTSVADGAAEEGTSEEGDGTEAVTEDGTAEDTTATTSSVPTTRPVGEVKVAVANGVGEAGLAGARSEVLGTIGYTIAATNAASDTAQSNVYYVEGYGDDARAVAIELGGDESVLRPAPTNPGELVGDATVVEGFHIIVVLGSDRVLG